ncbi:cell division protein ZapD [Methylococcus sp. EFPC2]|uniref:cell division protein ZapD n=1 Tax=Methylococcus sp. EFPC2 TaxID=2812648 RepID=UPI001F086F7C|nr:cell division protein ZapD [Methylococcus sp. EFPC2]
MPTHSAARPPHTTPAGSPLNDLVLYEFPLNERIRVFMRLEQLFLQADHFMQGNSVWDSRAVIATLLEILALFSRNDLKSESLKELDRHAGVFGKLARSQGIDAAKLSTLLSQLESLSGRLYASAGKIGQPLAENELFKAIAQRSAIPGGTCPFDLPAYHYWLQQGDALRKRDLEDWLAPFATIRAAIDLVLNTIRQSGEASEEVAPGGFFQKTLDHALPFQLLRVALSKDQACFAEISGGKHRFTIRFMTSHTNERPTQTNDKIDFQLTCCMV